MKEVDLKRQGKLVVQGAGAKAKCAEYCNSDFMRTICGSFRAMLRVITVGGQT